MYIPIKNVTINRNLQCKRKYNCAFSQSLLLCMQGPSFLIYTVPTCVSCRAGRVFENELCPWGINLDSGIAAFALL